MAAGKLASEVDTSGCVAPLRQAPQCPVSFPVDHRGLRLRADSHSRLRWAVQSDSEIRETLDLNRPSTSPSQNLPAAKVAQYRFRRSSLQSRNVMGPALPCRSPSNTHERQRPRSGFCPTRPNDGLARSFYAGDPEGLARFHIDIIASGRCASLTFEFHEPATIEI